jgi:dimethylamine/trimethylamine dehydrogenase
MPEDGLVEALVERQDLWLASGVVSVKAVGDAWSPGTIAAAVWDGRRYAEELDGPGHGDAVSFRREIVRLAPLEEPSA